MLTPIRNRKLDELDNMFAPTLPRKESFERRVREQEQRRLEREEQEEREFQEALEAWKAEQAAKKSG